ncbi:MAG: methyltransferase domain-containing protein [Acidobacteriia bacterium]|nr:methyltransferase domain-containing protein [Terriglobia bacterium]
MSDATSLSENWPRNIWLDATREVAKNLAMALPPVRAWRLRSARAGASFTGADAALERYAWQATRNLTDLLGGVKGLHIVEIGPGDYLTSGLALLAAGAASYTAIDRFPGDHTGATAKAWYRGIAAAWPRCFPMLPWPEYLRAEDFPEAYPDRAKLIAGPIERVHADGRFDVVCSYQVGEHVTDIDAFAHMSAQLLAPEGVAVHRVDFGPHDCWFYYPDTLTFLRFPEWLWRLMGSQRGTPNRRRDHEFRAAFEHAGFHVELASIERFEVGDFDLTRLPPRFQAMPRESLDVSAAVYLCRLQERYLRC